jgi:hypothetical protein
MIGRNLASVFLGALVLVVCGGCVHQKIVGEGEPIGKTTLTVTRSGESVQLSWKSDTGKTYDILYSENLVGKTEWKVLPGAGKIRGTGDAITFTDSIANDVSRYYRLNISLESQRKASR